MEILSKTLSETDVNRRCAIPMKYFKMKRFPKLQGNDKVDFVVKDESGEDHTLCCSKRKLGNGPSRPKHPKPVLIKGWIPLVRKKKLHAGDRVIIYEEQDERGSMMSRIKVEKQTSPAKPHCSPVKNKGSTTNNGDTGSTATFQPFGKSDLGGTYSATSSSIDKAQKPTSHRTSQDVYTTEKPSLSLSLELTLKPAVTLTGGDSLLQQSPEVKRSKHHSPTTLLKEI